MWIEFLERIHLPPFPANFTKSDFAALKKSVYNPKLKKALLTAEQISLQTLLQLNDSSFYRENTSKTFRVEYKDIIEFKQIASKFGLMYDIWVRSKVFLLELHID